jgi:hypothetical protein
MRETSERAEPPPDRSAWREGRKDLFGEGGNRPEPDVGETRSGLAAGARERPLREFREQFRKEYFEPDTSAAERLRGEPHHGPERFVGTINPHFSEGDAWQYNCCDCARAVECTWRGRPEVAAGIVNEEGEDLGRTESWSGSTFQEMKSEDPLSEVGQRLQAGGHGSSAIVAVEATNGDDESVRHVFNAVNRDGKVWFVDGQDGHVTDWPPTEHVRGWQDWKIHRIRMMGFDRDGRSWW